MDVDLSVMRCLDDYNAEIARERAAQGDPYHPHYRRTKGDKHRNKRARK